MKIRVNIAANAKAVTLGQYIDYCNAVDAAERVRVITGKSMDSIKLLQASVIDEIIMKFEAAIQLCTDGFERKVRVGAIELGFILDLTEMTFGEYVDLDSACTGLYKDGKLDADAALKMMSILYRPVTAKWAGRYDIDKYDSTKVGRYIDPMSLKLQTITVRNGLEQLSQQAIKQILLLLSKKKVVKLKEQLTFQTTTKPLYIFLMVLTSLLFLTK